MFHTDYKSSTNLLESALASSANIFCSRKVFVLGGRSYLCILKSEEQKT